MVFIEAPAFTRYVSDYLDEEQYRVLQVKLANNPEIGAVMQDTGGFRKARWPDQRRSKGRRGGLRIIYYYFSSDQQIWLMTLYSKDEIGDLSAKEKKILRASIESELKTRRAKRPTRGPKSEKAQ
jgi:mRNA-degrading endonuclease RelE of RelBE toxin-antitoxin system